MWHEHRVDTYFGALFITVVGALAVFFIMHTIKTLPAESFSEAAIIATH